MKIDSRNKNVSDLLRVFLALKNEKECWKFFRDLLTEAEIKEFANRWKVARMLDQKNYYEAIEKETGVSSTTIARVNKWRTKGEGGFKTMLRRLK